MYTECRGNVGRGAPNNETDSCLDPELPGTGLRTEGGEGPGPPYSGEKSQLNPAEIGKTWGKMEENPFRI